MPCTAAITHTAQSPGRQRPLACLLWLLLCGSCMSQMSQVKQRFCGKTLNEAMDQLCINGFNMRFAAAAQKRVTVPAAAAITTADNEFRTASADAQLLPYAFSYSSSPFLDHMYGNMLVNTRRRRDGGVYEECCRQPCTYKELAGYCLSS